MRQIRIAGSILAVMLLVSACANAPDEEMVVPSLDVTVEMPSETENDDSNTDAIRQSIVAVNGIEYDLISADISELVQTLEETGIHAKNVKDHGNDSQHHSDWVKYELYTDTQRNCGFLLGRSSGENQLYKAKFLLANLVGTDFVVCNGLWNLGDSNAASFPDVKTLESAGFENYEDGYRLLIESEKKENYIIKVSGDFCAVIFSRED